MLNYTPNFQDPRVLRRVKRALGWARACLSPTKNTHWSQSAINRRLGHQSHDLGQWLRQHLVVTASDYYSPDQGITKSYRLNQWGSHYVAALVSGRTCLPYGQWRHWIQDPESGLDTPVNDPVAEQALVRDYITEELGTQLQTLDFVYKEQHHRLWNPLQRVRRAHKQQILCQAGLPWQYDIQAAAPTLILALARQRGLDLWLPALQTYLLDRAHHRQRLSHLTGVCPDSIKAIINALFCGARLGCNPEYAIYGLLDQNQTAVRALQQDTWLRQLQLDIRECWQAIEQGCPARYHLVAGRSHRIPRTQRQMFPPVFTTIYQATAQGQRKMPITSRAKWDLYFRLERAVLDVVRGHLDSTGNRYFLEHDGWQTAQPIDRPVLQSLIKQILGFDVIIELVSGEQGPTP